MARRRFALVGRIGLHTSRSTGRQLQQSRPPLCWPLLRGQGSAPALRQLQLLQSCRASAGTSSPIKKAAKEEEEASSDNSPSSASAAASSGHAGPNDQKEEIAEDGEIPPEVMDLFDTLRGEALRRLDEFGPIHLFSLCWAYSTARLLDDDLQKQVTNAALRLGRNRDQDARPAKKRGPIPAPQAPPPPSAPPEVVREEGSATAGMQPAREVREPPHILAQTEHWMALYKPPFWLVSVDSKEAAKAAASTPFEDEDEGDADDEIGIEGDRKRPRVHMWIRQNLAHQYPVCTDPVEAHGLLHRLDAQTSGILLCAKTYVGAYWLRLQWCSYTVDKEYVCLVHGWVDKNVREVHKRIRIDKKKAENSRRTISTHCSISPSGKPSYTELFTLAHLVKPGNASESQVEQPGAQVEMVGTDIEEEQRFSLVVLKLHTGRTHQIRVHMLSIGHPLVCDSKYAEERLASDRAWCPRNFLHTYRLGFEDVPGRDADRESEANEQSSPGQLVDVICPIPKDLRDVLEKLQPVDDTSAARREEWMSGDSSKLLPFEEYASADTAMIDSASDSVTTN